MEDQREALLRQIWAAQDEAYDLMYEYDSLPHQYGANTLYQSEAQIIDHIGEQPGITVTELAAILKKTPSACSQLVRKLRAKGWVTQVRNEANNRIRITRRSTSPASRPPSGFWRPSPPRSWSTI